MDNHQGFALHEGIRPIVLMWKNVGDGKGGREWQFEGAEHPTWYSYRHRKTKPLHLDFKRQSYGHD
jgi:hypothetical protein